VKLKANSSIVQSKIYNI